MSRYTNEQMRLGRIAYEIYRDQLWDPSDEERLVPWFELNASTQCAWAEVAYQLSTRFKKEYKRG